MLISIPDPEEALPGRHIAIEVNEKHFVNGNLIKGKYIQCHGCRHPITIEDTELNSYKKGISCRYCHKKRTRTQKKRSSSRQNQINIAEKKGVYHSFKKIRIQEINS